MMVATTPETTQKPARSGINFSLAFKLIFWFTLIFSLVFGVAFYWFYTFTTDTARTRIEADLDGTLLGGAAQINGDNLEQLIAEFQEPITVEVSLDDDGNPMIQNDVLGGAPTPIIEEERETTEIPWYPDTELYWDHAAFLLEIALIEDRAQPYTFIVNEENEEIIFIGSAGAVLPTALGGPIGASYRQSCTVANECASDIEPNLRAFQGETNFQDFYEDEFGEWISGYAPIYNSDGEVVAGLGIDFRADYVREVQENVRDGVFIAFVIAYVTLFVLVYIISTTLTRPIRQLTNAAKAIGEGDYDQNLDHLSGHRLRDEIDVLATVFTDMASKVYKREEKLKKQVAELKIKIDEDKAAKQVSEIVETDFFEDLQQRAKDLRKQRDDADAARAARKKDEE